MGYFFLFYFSVTSRGLRKSRRPHHFRNCDRYYGCSRLGALSQGLRAVSVRFLTIE